MLDGVDELPPSRRPIFWKWIADFISHYPGNRVIITSRTLPRSIGTDANGRSDQWDPPEGFVDAQLEDMSNSDIVRFIEQWHLSVIVGASDLHEKESLASARVSLIQKLSDPANRRIRDLCNTPLLCAMVCVLHWKEEGYLPRQRVELYDRCCEMLIEARDKKREINVTSGPLAALTKNDKEAVLQKLAFQMMNDKLDGDENDNPDGSSYRIEITRDKAAHWVEPWIKNFSQIEAQAVKANELIDNLIERTGLLREPATGLIDYPHRTFQEYLAACAAGADGAENFLAKQASDDQWHETIMLAAGTTTGGVPFGRALIDALLRRAERHKSTKPSSQRIRKMSVALALGCLENLRQQDAAARTRVLSYLNELLPPRNSLDARILSVAGDAAVPLLAYRKWKDESTATVAACAQALRLIGTAQSTTALRDGYISDVRPAVASEVCRAESILYTDVPIVVSGVDEFGALPEFVVPSDVRQLKNLVALKRLSLKSPIPANSTEIGEMHWLETARFEDIPIPDIISMQLPESLEHLRLTSCAGLNLDLVSRLPSLRSLDVVRASQNLNYDAISKLSKLSSLNLSFSDVKNLSFLNGLSKLNRLRLLQCYELSNLRGLEASQDLQQVDIGYMFKLTSLESLCGDLLLKQLAIYSCPDVEMSTLEENNQLEQGEFRDIPDFTISKIYGFKGLVELSIESCNHESDPVDYSHFARLKNLNIHDSSKFVASESLRKSDVNRLSLGAIRGFDESVFYNLPEGLNFLELESTGGYNNLIALSSTRNIDEMVLTESSIVSLRGIEDLKSLKTLRLRFCEKLGDISEIAGAESLERFELINCPGIESLSALSGCVNMNKIVIGNIGNNLDLNPSLDLPRLESIIILNGKQKGHAVPEKPIPLVNYLHGPGRFQGYYRQTVAYRGGGTRIVRSRYIYQDYFS